MNSLNKTNESNQNLPDNNKQNALKSEIIQSFKNFFNNAEKKTTEKVETEPKKTDPKSSSNKEKKSLNEPRPITKEFKFTNNESDIQKLFSELGTSITDQIEQLLITISNHVEKASQIPETSHNFSIKFADTQFSIKLKTNPSSSTLNIKCDKELCQLLLQHLPELKKHLRKKSFNFDDIIIEEETNNEESPKNKK